MAREAGEFDTWRRPLHDGAPVCALCPASGANADHEWCLAAESLVCDGCCSALLRGDIMRLFSISAHTGRVVTPDELFDACSQCERGRRHAQEELLGDVGEGDAPVC